MDIPNERSSHAIPTPRGGGLAIVVASASAMIVLTIIGVISIRLFAAFATGGLAVAAVGFLDDRRPLSARTRLVVHILAAACAVACIGPVREFALGGDVVRLSWVGYAISVVGIAWFLNVFNFMDGIDGIAASEAAFVCGSIALITKLTGGAPGVIVASCVIGSASMGFLVWNLPPARIFMGDIGSGYLGFGIAVLGLERYTVRPVPGYGSVWLVCS